MNREQAKIALSEGKTLTHKYFGEDEWVKGYEISRRELGYL